MVRESGGGVELVVAALAEPDFDAVDVDVDVDMVDDVVVVVDMKLDEVVVAILDDAEVVIAVDVAVGNIMVEGLIIDAVITE